MKPLVLVAFLVGCTDFQTIDRGVCGNGIVEPGEDCDSADDSCRQCQLVCSPTAACPAGYVCGGGICSAPGGQLTASTDVDTISVRDLRVTDLDKDGIADLIGLSATSLTERYGDRVQPLAKALSVLTPVQLGAAGFGDLDGDGATDVMLPTADGLVGYQSKYGTPSPLPMPSSLDPGLSDTRLEGVFSIQPKIFGAFTQSGAMPAKLYIIDLGFLSSPGAGAGPIELCDLAAQPADLDLAAIDVYDASKSGEAQYVVGIPATVGGVRKECLLSIRIDPSNDPTKPSTVNVYTMTPKALVIADRAVLANLDLFENLFDVCPSLIARNPAMSTSDLVLDIYDGIHSSSGPAQCTIAKTVGNSFTLDLAPSEKVAATSHLLGRVPLVPAAIIGTAADALVTEQGMFLYVQPGVTIPSYPAESGNFGLPLYLSQRRLKGVASGDVNGDGQTDAVLIPDGSDDLDVLLRHHVSATEDGYAQFRIDTTAEVEAVEIADFDGNGLGDIAYTELIGDHRRLMVAYRTEDGFSAPEEKSNFAKVSQLMAIEVPSSQDLIDQCADLIVEVPSQGDQRLTLMFGSPNRTLIPVYDPRGAGTGLTDTSNYNMRDVSIGLFVPGDVVDVFALAAPPPAAAGAGSVVRGFAIQDMGDGLLPSHRDSLALSGLVDCQTAGSATAALCDDGDTLSLRLAQGYDVVVAIDRNSHGGMIDPTIMPVTAQPFPLPASTTGAIVHNIFAADLHGSGASQLIATFESPGATAGAVVRCDLQATGLPANCTDLADAVRAFDAGVTSCIDAAAGQFGFLGPTDAAPSGRDLIVACLAGTATKLYRIAPDDSVHALYDPQATLPVFLRGGDFDGDGVDDLVFVHGAPGAQTLTLLHQCTSRDCKEAP